MTNVYCPECGHQSKEEGKYCSKCGALLPEAESEGQETIRYSLDAEEKDIEEAGIEDVAEEGVSLVVRSGGGLAGESFLLAGETTTIGRSPGNDIFLDDITVSRDHAVIVRKHDGNYINDQGSLNGTYVNRTRVETRKLFDGDLLQIGKYKLTYIEK